MSGPTGKWQIARRQLSSHHSYLPFDPEGQGAAARQKKSGSAYLCVRQANGKLRGGSSSATAAITHLTPRGSS